MQEFTRRYDRHVKRVMENPFYTAYMEEYNRFLANRVLFRNGLLRLLIHRRKSAPTIREFDPEPTVVVHPETESFVGLLDESGPVFPDELMERQADYVQEILPLHRSIKNEVRRLKKLHAFLVVIPTELAAKEINAMVANDFYRALAARSKGIFDPEFAESIAEVVRKHADRPKHVYRALEHVAPHVRGGTPPERILAIFKAHLERLRSGAIK